MTFALLGLGLLAGVSAEPPASRTEDVRRAYQEQRAGAGRTPDDQVRLALWCESHGLAPERLKHLALAVLTDPSHATARGLMGLVAYQGKWQPPDAVAARIKADRKMAEVMAAYDARREKMPESADSHWRLAVWCEQNGLNAEATAHRTSVIRLDPSREAAWKKLGYTRRNGRWMTDAQLASATAYAEACKLADRAWTPALEKWKGMLSRETTRPEAEAGLVAVADPLAVGPIVRVFGASGRPSDHARAVQLLGQIDTPASSQALTFLASRSEDADVRRAAREILSHRDPREYVGSLLARLERVREPVRYQLGTTPDQYGRPHPSLFLEGARKNVRIDSSWTLNGIQAPVPARLFADSVPFGGPPPSLFGDQGWAGDMYGFPTVDGPRSVSPFVPTNGRAATAEYLKGHLPKGTTIPGLQNPPNAADSMVAYYTRMAMIRDAQIARATTYNENAPILLGPNFRSVVNTTIAEVEANNASITENRSDLFETLRQTTKQRLPDDAEAWKAWYADALGYSYRSSDAVQTDQDSPKPTVSFMIISCFAAGTPVRTIAGDRPIETLRVGDRVLSQDTVTGALAYRPITRVHRNPPSEVLRVRLGGETILATGFHRFWKAGQGWVMARELKEGDVLRTLGGRESVEVIEPDRVQPVFNLDVADDSDFFVGRIGALVHDNTLPNPRALPFDAPGPVAMARRRE